MEEKDIFAFVLMPFSSDFDDIYKFGVKEPAAELGVLAERVDEQIYSEGILERIYRQIDLADIIIADMSGQNPNVFYEVGYAHAKGKLCIHLTSDANDIPFDLKHRRHIVYQSSINTLKERIVEEITAQCLFVQCMLLVDQRSFEG
jgi:nucleoside 2-deoxyribosyltransferase